MPGAGPEVQGKAGKLCDAQGSEIPIEATKDMEIRLMDVAGKLVVLRERVAISSKVFQPILCYGRLLGNGWGIDGQQQVLIQHAGANVLIEMQNKQVMARGFIRVLQQSDNVSTPVCVRLIQAEVMPDVVNGRIGWNLDDRECGIGKHFGDCYHDPTLVPTEVSDYSGSTR